MSYKNLSVAGVAFAIFLSCVSHIIWRVYLFKSHPDQSKLNTTTGIILKSRISKGFDLKTEDGDVLTVSCGIYIKPCAPNDSDTLNDYFGDGIINDKITVKWYHHDYIGNLVYEITRNGKKEITYKYAIKNYKNEIRIIKNDKNPTDIKISLLALVVFFIEIFRRRDDLPNT